MISSILEVVSLLVYDHRMPDQQTDQQTQPSADSWRSRHDPVGSGGSIDLFAHDIHELLFELLLLLRGQVEAVASSHGLSSAQFLVLRSLDSPRAMRELAGALRCDASNITGIIDRLEQRGLVERQVARDDRRVKHIIVTPEGERLRDQLQRQLIERSPAVTALTAGERYALVGLLRRLMTTT